MAGLAGSVEEGFYSSLLFTWKIMILPSAHNLTMGDFIAARGERFPDLGGDLVSSAVEQEDKSS